MQVKTMTNNSGHMTNNPSERSTLLLKYSSTLANVLRKRRFESTLQAKALGDFLAYASNIPTTLQPLNALSLFSRYCLIISKSNGKSKLGRILGGSSANQVYVDVIDEMKPSSACVSPSMMGDFASFVVTKKEGSTDPEIQRDKQSPKSIKMTSTVDPTPVVSEEDVLADARSTEETADPVQPLEVCTTLPSNHEPPFALSNQEHDADETLRSDREVQDILSEPTTVQPPTDLNEDHSDIKSESGITDDLRENIKARKSNSGKHQKPYPLPGDPLGIPDSLLEAPSASTLRARRVTESGQKSDPGQYLEMNEYRSSEWHIQAPTRDFYDDRRCRAPCSTPEPEPDGGFGIPSFHLASKAKPKSKSSRKRR